MPRIFRIVSIVAHVVVVGAAFVAQLVAIGPLPVPREPMTFVGAMPIVLKDIPLPRPPRRTAAPPSDEEKRIPLEPPSRIIEEARREPEGPAPSIGAVDGSIDIGQRLVEVPRLPAAPPSPPTAQPSSAPVRVFGMQAPRKLVHVDPTYPAVARSAHVEGVVILEATLDSRGRVVDVRVLRSVPLLDAAAVDAVRQWIYTPTLLSGTAVPVVMTVTVNFKLTDR